MSDQWLKDNLVKLQQVRHEQYNQVVGKHNLPIYMIVDRASGQPRDRFHLIEVGHNRYRRYFIDFEPDSKIEWDLSWHPDNIAEFFNSGWWVPVEPISHKDFLLRWKTPSPKIILSQST